MQLNQTTEGKAKLLVYSAEKISSELPVFYNPVMKFNRDVSVALLKALGKKDLIIADIMAGSGVRAIRFFKELPKKMIKELHVNDSSADAVKLIKKNFKLNEIHSKKIFFEKKDANKLLLDIGKADYIDIDPFGSPNYFLDSACKKLSDKGILAVTATDTSALSGTYPESCLRKYWAKPLKNELMHETGLRILIRKVQLIGAQHDKALTPIFSYSSEHYMRIFFVCEKSKTKVDELIRRHQFLLYCSKCGERKISNINTSICCKIVMQFAGPLWTGQLWDKKITQRINLTDKLIRTIKEESKIDALWFYDIHEICSITKFTPPKKDELIKEIKKRKYAVAETHFTPTGLRSTIGLEEMKEIISNPVF